MASERKLPKNSNIEIKENSKKEELFNYQEEAIKNLERLDSSYQHYYRTLVVVPTGGGKTRIAIEYLYKNVLSQKGKKVLWVCERLSLLSQAYKAFENLATRNRLGGKALYVTAHIFSSKNTSFRDENLSKDVQLILTTKQTLCKILDCEEGTSSNKDRVIYKEFYDWLVGTEGLTVVIDEAHHAVEKDYENILGTLSSVMVGGKKRKPLHIIGLTATPKNTERFYPIDNVFFHGVDGKHKATTTTCYASRVSINQLIAEGYLAKPFLAKKDKPKSDKELYKSIADTYLMGVSSLTLKALQSQEKKCAKLPKIGAESFGQTVIFIESRDKAIELWVEFRNREIDCGLSISIDGKNNLDNHKDKLQNYLDTSLSSDQIVKVYEERYASNILPVIVSVDKFKEGVDVPKTQTVFIARDSSTEISVTQMVGRALRGVLQGGTSEAYLVEFGDEQLDKVLWEVPESSREEGVIEPLLQDFKVKKYMDSNNVDEEDINLLEELEKIDALKFAENSKSIANVLMGKVIRNNNNIVNNDILVRVLNSFGKVEIPIGYMQVGQRYLLVWDNTKNWFDNIIKVLKDLDNLEVQALWSVGKNSLLNLRDSCLDDFIYKKLCKMAKNLDRGFATIFWNYVHTILFYVYEVLNEDLVKGLSELDEFKKIIFFYDFNSNQKVQDLIKQIENETDEEKVSKIIDTGWERLKIEISKEVQEEYFKKYLEQYSLKYHKAEAEKEKSDYFRIRLYRDGRKRENLVKLLQLIIQGGKINKEIEEDFDFYDVFGGTGTMTVCMDKFCKGVRHFNEVDTVLCRVLYLMKEYSDVAVEDFEEKFEEFHNKWVSHIEEGVATDIKAMQKHIRDIFGDYENFTISEFNTEYKEKQKHIQSRLNELKEIANDQSQKNEVSARKIKENYERLSKLKQALKNKQVEKFVKLYLGLYVIFNKHLKRLNTDSKKYLREVWNDEINSASENDIELQHEDYMLLYAFIYVYSFSSNKVSVTSKSGVNPTQIEQFKKILKEDTEWLSGFSDRLQGVDITSKGFEKILPKISDDKNKSDVYYLDPPYFLTKQYVCKFSEANHLDMLKWLRETECNWIFSCKALETNMTLLNRKKKEGEKYIKTGEKTLEEYFKLFLYGESEKIMRKENGEEYREISADVSSGKIQKKKLYVYYAEPLKGNKFETKR